MKVLLFQFLMMASALQGVSGLNEMRHILKEPVAGPFFFGPHELFVEIQKDNIS